MIYFFVLGVSWIVMSFGSITKAEPTFRVPLSEQFISSKKQSVDCPPLITQSERTAPPQPLLTLFELEKQNGNHCEAATLAYDLMMKAETDSSRLQWGEATVTELVAAGDVRDATIMGLRTYRELEDNRSLSMENLRFLILLAVDSAIHQIGHEYNGQWLAFGLNLQGETPASTDLLSYSSFIQDFPKSPWLPFVREKQQSALHIFFDRELEIANQLTIRGEYMAAIVRLERLYKFELIQTSPRLAEVMTKIVESQKKFASAIADNHAHWSDRRLQYIFRIPLDEPVNRESLSRRLLQKAQEACQFMRQNFLTTTPIQNACL